MRKMGGVEQKQVSIQVRALTPEHSTCKSSGFAVPPSTSLTARISRILCVKFSTQCQCVAENIPVSGDKNQCWTRRADFAFPAPCPQPGALSHA